MSTELKNLIEAAFVKKELLQQKNYSDAVLQTLELLDQGRVRVAEPVGPEWQINDWVKKAILLYFVIRPMENLSVGPFEYSDKIPLKRKESFVGVRVVPGAVFRYGSFAEKSVILMPSFVNLGAYIGEGSAVDTWATVGSCAQIGKRVHLSGGVGIGGVLEPPQAAPVIIEDDVFVGSRCIVVEGVRVGRRAVLGAGTVLTSSTKILDVSGSELKEYAGFVPPNSVVIPGTRMKEYPAGTFGIPAALIIGQRKASTDEKTSLNDTLRDFNVPV